MELRRYQAINKYEQQHWWYQGRQVLLNDLFAKLNLPNKAKILDIGCGAGLTLLNLQKFGQTFGVDISPEALRFCRKKGLVNLKLVKENQPLPFKTNTFDLITCIDVLEHVNDDLAQLKEIKRILKPDGYLIIFVPALKILWSKLDNRSHHLRRYDKSSLLRLIQRARFKIIQINYFNWLMFLPILIIRLWQKLSFGQQNTWGDEPKIQSLFINKFLKMIFVLDIKSAPILNPPLGVSLMAVVKKQK